MQLLTVPCYFMGATAYMIAAYLSDRMQQRGLFSVGFGIISVIGYGILLADTSSGAHYFACFMVAAGLYVVVGLPLAWVSLDVIRGVLLKTTCADRGSFLPTPRAMGSAPLQQACSLHAATSRASCRPSSSKSSVIDPSS